MKNRKILAVLLAASMAVGMFSLTACSKDDSKEKDSKKHERRNDDDEDEDDDDDEPDETKDEKPEETEKTEKPEETGDDGLLPMAPDGVFVNTVPVDYDRSGLDNETASAVDSALSYITFTGFSREGLIKQLTSPYGEDLDEELAVAAVDFLEDNNLVSWDDEAIECAEGYVTYLSVSRQAVYDYLCSDYGDGFTPEQAEEAIHYVEDKGIADWDSEAVEALKELLSYDIEMTYDETLEYLTSDWGGKFTEDEAVHAMDELGVK